MKKGVVRFLLIVALLSLIAFGSFFGYRWWMENLPPELVCVDAVTVECGQRVSVFSLVESMHGQSQLTLTMEGGTPNEKKTASTFSQTGKHTLTITATDEKGHATSCTVQVLVSDTQPPVINVSDWSVSFGEEIDYLSNLTVEDSVDGDLRSAVRFDCSQVKEDEPGTYPVIYTATDKSGNLTTAEVKLTILPPAAQKLLLSAEQYELEGNGHYQITAEVQPENWQGKIHWSSSDPKVATVYGGLVTWHSKGTAVITASAGDQTAECKITCRSLQASSLKLDHHRATLGKNATLHLNTSILPSNYAGKVSWRSSDPSVATVKNGVVKWVGTGSCTITASVDGAKDRCSVTCQGSGNFLSDLFHGLFG